MVVSFSNSIGFDYALYDSILLLLTRIIGLFRLAPVTKSIHCNEDADHSFYTRQS
jgi:hypothetical protein